jgi:general secretion pathway protein N
MTRYGVVLGLMAGLSLFGEAESQTFFVGPPMSVSLLDNAVTPGGAESRPAPLMPLDAAKKNVPSGNPLWAVPLKVLSVTRERPIFSPSRRPPPTAVVGLPASEPVRPLVEPTVAERPRLALVGTVAGEKESFAVFIDETSKDVIRLKTGENYAGWILRSVTGREVVLQKDSETAVIALPAPGTDKGGPGQPPPLIGGPEL